jgi:hypothetical protein
MNEKSANEVTEIHGSIAEDPRNADLQHAHDSLVGRVDRIVARLRLVGIHVGEGIAHAAASAAPAPVAIDTKQLAAPAAPEPTAIEESAGDTAAATKPSAAQLALLDDEEIWKEMDRRSAERLARIHGSPLAFYGQPGNQETHQLQDATKTQAAPQTADQNQQQQEASQ